MSKWTEYLVYTTQCLMMDYMVDALVVSSKSGINHAVLVGLEELLKWDMPSLVLTTCMKCRLYRIMLLFWDPTCVTKLKV